jgi:N-methylhydantoinase A
MRYAGQNYELEVDLPDGALDEQGFAALLEGFAAAHLRQYGFALPGEAVEIINLRVTASAAETPPATAFAGSAGAERDSRRVAFDGDGPIDCPVRRRESLSVGELLHGPMIVEEADSTTMIPPGDSARVLADGVLEIALGGAR